MVGRTWWVRTHPHFISSGAADEMMSIDSARLRENSLSSNGGMIEVGGIP